MNTMNARVEHRSTISQSRWMGKKFCKSVADSIALASDSGDADPPRPSSSGFPLPCALDRADDAFIAQQFRHLASRDFLSQPFDDGGLSNPCFTDQDWVVFGAPAEDLNHAFNLVLATDDRIQLALFRQLGQIAAERAQGGRLDIFLIALLRGLSLAFRRYEVRIQFF